MKFIFRRMILALVLVATVTSLTSLADKVKMSKGVFEIFKQVTQERFVPVNEAKDYTWRREPLAFEYMAHDNKAQVHGEGEAFTDVDIEQLKDDAHKISQITYRYGMQVAGKEESLQQVFQVTFLLDQDDSLYLHYTNGIVDGRTEIDYNSPIGLSDAELQDPNLKIISRFLTHNLKAKLKQYVDNVIQTIPSAEKLGKDLEELNSKLGEIQSSFRFGQILMSKASEDPSKITSQFFDLQKELHDLLNRDAYYGLIFRDQSGKEQMFVDLLGVITGGPQDDPFHNLHLYDGFIHHKETPSFKAMFDIKETNFILFEITSTNHDLKQFGPLECLIVFYPIRQILVIKVRSAFFTFQIDVNVMTKVYVSTVLTSILKRIENELFMNIQILQTNNHHVKLSEAVDNLAATLKFKSPEAPKEGESVTHFKSDKYGGNLNCRIQEHFGLRLCTTHDASSFMVTALFTSRPLANQPEDEDPEGGTPKTVESGVEGRTRKAAIPEVSFPETVVVEKLIVNPYLFSPDLKIGVQQYVFPTSSIFDLRLFVRSTINSVFKVDDGLDLSSGKWAPHQLTVVESTQKMDPPVDGQTEMVVFKEEWQPIPGFVIPNFDYTPFNPTTILSSPKCVDFIAQMNHEMDDSPVANGMTENYRLKMRVKETRLEPYWDKFGGRLLAELRNMRKSII